MVKLSFQVMHTTKRSTLIALFLVGFGGQHQIYTIVAVDGENIVSRNVPPLKRKEQEPCELRHIYYKRIYTLIHLTNRSKEELSRCEILCWFGPEQALLSKKSDIDCCSWYHKPVASFDYLSYHSNNRIIIRSHQLSIVNDGALRHSGKGAQSINDVDLFFHPDDLDGILLPFIMATTQFSRETSDDYLLHFIGINPSRS